jgi:hypothetical protein
MLFLPPDSKELLLSVQYWNVEGSEEEEEGQGKSEAELGVKKTGKQKRQEKFKEKIHD